MQNNSLAIAYDHYDLPQTPLNPGVADDSESLVRRIRQRDCGAENLLAARFQQRIAQIGRQLGADKHLCEDLSQEVLLKVILNLRENRLKDATKLTAYISQIARFTYYQWQRNKNSQLELKASCDDTKHSNDVEQEYLRACNHLWIRQQIGKLSMLRDKHLLIRFYLEQQDKPDICVALDLTPDQFDKLICRARQRLKKIIHV